MKSFVDYHSKIWKTTSLICLRDLDGYPFSNFHLPIFLFRFFFSLLFSSFFVLSSKFFSLPLLLTHASVLCASLMYKGIPLGRCLNWAQHFYHVTRVDDVISSSCLRAKCRIVFMQTTENGFWKEDNALILVFMPAVLYCLYFPFRLNKSDRTQCIVGAAISQKWCQVIAFSVGHANKYIITNHACADEVI